MKRFRYILCTLLLLASTLTWADIPQRPQPQRLVNDFAGIFNGRQVMDLEQTLVAFDDSTSNQITVVTVLDLEGYTAAEYAAQIGHSWQVGQSEFDNGIVLLVKPKTEDSYGEVFIAVGYGLEGAIPDAYAKRIIETDLIPHFREDDYYGGVYEACQTLMKLASGEISEPRGGSSEDDTSAIIAMVVFILAVFFLIAIVSKGSKGSGGSNNSGGGPFYTGPIFTTKPSSFGGSSFGGGGFSGGGFGGFGGGGFGGGGAGGRW